MMTRLLRYRTELSILLASLVAWLLWQRVPFPEPYHAVLLNSFMFHSERLYELLRFSWAFILWSLPLFYVILPISGLLYRVVVLDKKKATLAGPLPLYPPVRQRESLFVILGETHLKDIQGPSEDPGWLAIPGEGLCLGVLAIGSPGTGKTVSVIMPAAEQIFGYRANDPAVRAGGLVLEVKGDLCPKMKKLLERYGRGEDYLEIGFDSDYCYNPLDPDQSPTSLAANLVALMDSLRGAKKGGESFWDDAAQALVMFQILLYRLTDGYVTLYDLRVSAGNMRLLATKMEEAAAALDQGNYIVLDKQVYLDVIDPEAKRAIDAAVWTNAGASLRTPYSDELGAALDDCSIQFSVESEASQFDYMERRAMLESARICHEELRLMDSKVISSVAKGITNFLEIFNVDPQARRIFCPPKEVFDPILNRDFRYGRPLPKLSEVIETSKVIALNLPIVAEEHFARISATLLKVNWQKAVLNRTPAIQANPKKYFRHLAMIIDEYHLLATVGGAKPIGDEKFLNLSREAKCIPVCAFQTLSSLKATVGEAWDVVFSAFATTIVLRQKSVFSAKEISTACGREDMIKDHYGVTEGSHDAGLSWQTGRTKAEKASVNLSHSYNITRDNVIEVKTVMELPRGVAIVLANDGRQQLAPQFVYLKPYGADPNDGYDFRGEMR